MLKAFTLLLFALLCQISYAQNVGINSTGATPDASAILDVASTSKGLLIPQVALTATNVAAPITSPATSLLIYNTATVGGGFAVSPGYYYWSGSWTRLASGGTLTNQWTTSTNDIYTNTTGSVGIASGAAPGFNATTATIGGIANQSQKEKFLVNAGTTTSRNAIVAKGSINSYLQLNIQNTSSGTSASSDVVATANNGDETNYYVDMGINSSTNNSNYFGGANDAYLYNLGEDFLIGTGTAAKSLKFLTGGSDEATNTRMTIDGSGNVDIKGNSTLGGTATGRLVVSNSSTTYPGGNPNTDIYNADDRMLKISNNGNTSVNGSGGASIQLKPSAENFLISLEGQSGFRYYSRTNGATGEKFGVTNTGNVSFLGALMPNSLPGSTGDVLISAGTNTPPVWISPATVLNGYAWTNTGNSGQTAAAFNTGSFIGNQDSNPLRFRTNNTQRMFIDASNGGVAIGSNPVFNITTATIGGVANQVQSERLLVDAGTTTSRNAIVAKGSINSYLQLNIQNSSAGTSASSDVVATANNGDENNYYVDMGINSSTNSSSYFGGANDAYLYNLGEDFLIGTGTAAKSLKFLTGGSSEASNTRMVIDGSGTVTITGSVVPQATNSYDLGVTGLRWRTLYANNIGNTITPLTDNAFNFGSATQRWGTIYATNNVINTSDGRLKKNIVDLEYGLKEVLSLQPVRYNWKDPKDTNNKIGLIAQDTRKIVPEVVYGDEAKENLGMSYSELIPVLINAIKEQQKQIEDLKKSDAENKLLINKLSSK